MTPAVEKTWTVARLRRAMVAVAVILLLAIVGFLLYAQWRIRHLAQDLPAKLGISIQQTTQGYVLSKTEKGRTVFKLRAARAVQFKSGRRVSLHQVEIDLYNPQGRADSISGDDFEYDPRNRIVQSQGTTEIVLYPPKQGGAGTTANGDAQPVQVTTHGLVFDQKTGVATCSGKVEFHFAQASGVAEGAAYDSKQGRLTLQSQVELTTVRAKQESTLDAAQAVYDRSAGRVELMQPRYLSKRPNGTEHAQSRQAVLTLGHNGGVQHVHAEGDVQIAVGDGMRVRSSMADVQFGDGNRARAATLSGGVQWSRHRAGADTTGSAQAAEVEFGTNSRVKQATFLKDVNILQRAGTGEHPMMRRLTGQELALRFGADKAQRMEMESAEASGNAVFQLDNVGGHNGPANTMLAGDTLTAQFLPGGQIQSVLGMGHTRIRTVGVNGETDTGTGDRFQADFDAGATGTGKSAVSVDGMGGSESIRHAVQSGHVVIEQTAGTKSGKGADGPLTATAERAEFSGRGQTLTLTGQPAFRDARMNLTASRIVLARMTGNVTMAGPVQATILSSGSGTGDAAGHWFGGKEPTHIIARAATLERSTGIATFSGKARLWQGSDSIEAPTIQLSRKDRTLIASSPQPCRQCVVGEFLGQAGAKAPGAAVGAAQSASFSPIRVLCEKLTYSDEDRVGTFLGGVEMIGGTGDLSTDTAKVYFSPERREPDGGKISGKARNSSGPASVQKIVATGGVQLTQPGRKATGNMLVYTAGDGRFVLTGNTAAPPRIHDSQRGTVTGEILTFNSTDRAIIVSGKRGETTTTRTQVKRKQK